VKGIRRESEEQTKGEFMRDPKLNMTLAALVLGLCFSSSAGITIREVQNEGWQTIEIENDLYKAILIPKIARLPYSFIFKPTGRDVFHHPKDLKTPKQGRKFVYYGGVIDCIPWVSGKVDGKRLPTKGYLHFSPWEHKTGQTERSVWWEGSTSFDYADPVSAKPSRLFFQKRITGYEGSARLKMDYVVRNVGEDEAKFALAVHARTKIADYDENDYFAAPGRVCQVYAMNNMTDLEARGIKRFAWTTWPLKEATDLVPGTKRKSIFAYLPASWCAVGDGKAEESLFFVGSPVVTAGRTDVMKMGIFMSHGAGAYVVEPCVSYSLEGSPEVWKRPGATVLLPKGETCEFSVSMVPYKDMPRAKVEDAYKPLQECILLEQPEMSARGNDVTLAGDVAFAAKGTLIVQCGSAKLAERAVEVGAFNLKDLGKMTRKEAGRMSIAFRSAAGKQELHALTEGTSTGNSQEIVMPAGKRFDGRKDHVNVPLSKDLKFGDQVSVEAWVDGEDPRAEVLQALVSQWAPLESLDTFSAYDAGKTSDLDTTGFLGAVFDGRYIYFSPQHGKEDRQGVALRYDTHGKFKDPASWLGYDAGNTDGLNTKGYYGAIFDGRYVTYVPRRNPESFHTHALRYDTRKPFDQPAGWEAYDVGLEMSCQSGAFDGRYIYFSPGAGKVKGKRAIVIRYDTQKPFKDKASWEQYDAADTAGLKTQDFDGAAFDGRHVYFAPLSFGAPLRYDTTRPFGEASSWSAFDATPLGMHRCVGIVFDGTYIYYCSYNTSSLVRYDTRRAFEQPEGWRSFDVHKIPGLKWEGYDGGFFDGRYVYFVPFIDLSTGIEGQRMMFHSQLVRYDTQGAFDDPASWKMQDVTNTDGLLTVGYNAGAFDGRYFYGAPWHDGKAYHEGSKIVGHGRVLRYDTLGDNGSFSLRYCDYGHNGGLNGAVPGPRFLVNTDRGVRTIAANKVLEPGRHHIVGVYTGKKIQLFIDGELVNEQGASGAIVKAALPVTVGRIQGGLGYFKGTIDRVTVFDSAKDAAWIAARHYMLKSGKVNAGE